MKLDFEQRKRALILEETVISEPLGAAYEIIALREALGVIAKGFTYDPGHSDLDDEQPIHVSMTLGDYRRAVRLLHEVQA